MVPSTEKERFSLVNSIPLGHKHIETYYLYSFITDDNEIRAVKFFKKMLCQKLLSSDDASDLVLGQSSSTIGQFLFAFKFKPE